MVRFSLLHKDFVWAVVGQGLGYVLRDRVLSISVCTIKNNVNSQFCSEVLFVQSPNMSQGLYRKVCVQSEVSSYCFKS